METLDANPQQGSTGTQMYHPSRKLKVPPTRRDARKLFVGGLPSNVTEEEFREFFEQYGAVVDSIVMFDRDTHRSRGFGFVTFEDPNVSRNLLETGIEDGQNGTLVGRVQMRGKVCEIKAAEPKEGTPHARGQGGGARREGRDAYPPMMYQGYPPMEAPMSPGANQDFPNSLQMSQPMMVPGAYGVPPYYPVVAAPMPMYAPPYVGYPPDAPYYEYEVLDPVYAPTRGIPAGSVMTAVAPGLVAEQPPDAAYTPYAFIPVPPVSPATRTPDDSPQSNGEEMNNY